MKGFILSLCFALTVGIVVCMFTNDSNYYEGSDVEYLYFVGESSFNNVSQKNLQLKSRIIVTSNASGVPFLPNVNMSSSSNSFKSERKYTKIDRHVFKNNQFPVSEVNNTRNRMVSSSGYQGMAAMTSVSAANGFSNSQEKTFRITPSEGYYTAIAPDRRLVTGVERLSGGGFLPPTDGDDDDELIEIIEDGIIGSGVYVLLLIVLSYCFNIYLRSKKYKKCNVM